MKRLSAGAAAALLFVYGHASSQGTKNECVTEAYQGQRLRDAGDLAAARAVLRRCVAATCPAMVVNDCSTWLAQVEARIPTVVLAAHDPSGRDLLHVRVMVDDRLMATELDGISVAVNPGPHRFLFTGDSGAVGEASIIAHEGEKDRIVSATLAPAHLDAGARSHEAGVSRAALIVGGVGVAAIGTFAGFGIVGESERTTLENGCATTHSCSAAAVDSAQTKLIVADVSLGVGVLALASAAYLWFTHRAASAPTSPPIALSPSARGVTALFSGSF